MHAPLTHRTSLCQTDGLISVSQWVDSSDLEPDSLETSPVRYHDAWRALVGAQYACYTLRYHGGDMVVLTTIDGYNAAVSWFPAVLANVGQKA